MRGIALSLAVAACLLAPGVRAPAQTLLPAGFRLSGGVALNGNEVTVNALANGTGTVTVNRVTWSEGGSVAAGRIGFKDIAPYGGLGYTGNFGGGLKLNLDAGALFGAAPVLPHGLLPGLPENLAVQDYYLETHDRSATVAPVVEAMLSVKF
jgi:hypothetical protein